MSHILIVDDDPEIRSLLQRYLESQGFGVGVKLNSSEFQKGGFEAEDAVAVVRMLNALPVDLVELSGGATKARPCTAAPPIRAPAPAPVRAKPISSISPAMSWRWRRCR